MLTTLAGLFGLRLDFALTRVVCLLAFLGIVCQWTIANNRTNHSGVILFEGSLKRAPNALTHAFAGRWCAHKTEKDHAISQAATSMNIAEEITKIEQFIREQAEQSQCNGVIIGISGGIDSAVAAFLSVRALGKEKVFGLLLPSHTTPDENESDAMQVVEKLRIDHARIPISEIIETFGKYLPEFKEGTLPKANLQARVRMCILYYFANLKNRLVCGTTDASENFLGYYTKYGDGAVDIEPIIHVTKTDLKLIARELGVPERIITKKSSPNLMAKHDAEEELGVQYEFLDKLLMKNKMTEHKRNPPASPQK